MTSPNAILAHAPEELCASSQLDRAVLSVIRNGAMIAHAAWFSGNEADAARAGEAPAADPPRLEHPPIETEPLRRRRSTIVADGEMHPRVHRPMAETMGSIAAELVISPRTVKFHISTILQKLRVLLSPPASSRRTSSSRRVRTCRFSYCPPL